MTNLLYQIVKLLLLQVMNFTLYVLRVMQAVKAFIGPETGRNFEQENVQKIKLVSKRIIVTNPKINGKTLGKMHFSSVYGVNVSRITRQGMDLFA